MSADPARKAALDVLTAALTRKAGLETALEGPRPQRPDAAGPRLSPALW
ncbi:MAG: hypothetical protein WDM85_19810 [Caulobacteraceae bacterium]